MRGPELDRMRDRDDFDPAVEGARYRLSRELSLVVWERACADASDDRGRLDAEQAQQRFHEFAARIAACGGRLRPDVGRLTRVGVELDGELPGIAAQLALRTAGRETLVASEARRWRPAIEGQAATADSAVAAAVDHDVAPHTDELRPAEVLDRRRRPHGPWFDDVELHAGSAERPTGQPTALPGFAGAAELRAQLLAAATRGRGASEALAAAADAASSPEDQYRYLFALAAFQDPALLRRALERTLSPQLRNQDVALYLARFFINEQAQGLAWAFVKEHWSALAPKVTIFGGDTNLIRSMGAFCEAGPRDEIAAFFAAHPLPAAARTLTQTVEQISSCIALKQRQTPAVTAWLSTRADR
jgi:hypothetical protein